MMPPLYTIEDRFEVIDSFVRENKILPGMTFETSILGDVAYIKCQACEVYESIIPEDIQKLASIHGYTIVIADHRRNVYVLRVK